MSENRKSLQTETRSVPDCDYLRSLEGRSDLTELGWEKNLPLFSGQEVLKAMGFKGESFTRSHKIAYRYFHDPTNRRMLGCAYFPTNLEGPIGCVHGGAIATALDEIFGFTLVREAGFGCVTANLTVNYRTSIPLGSTVAFDARLSKEEGRKRRLDGKLFDPQTGKTYADGHALFLSRSARGTLVPWTVMCEIMGPQSQLTPQQIVQLIKQKKPIQEELAPHAKL